MDISYNNYADSWRRLAELGAYINYVEPLVFEQWQAMDSAACVAAITDIERRINRCQAAQARQRAGANLPESTGDHW